MIFGMVFHKYALRLGQVGDWFGGTMNKRWQWESTDLVQLSDGWKGLAISFPKGKYHLEHYIIIGAHIVVNSSCHFLDEEADIQKEEIRAPGWLRW